MRYICFFYTLEGVCVYVYMYVCVCVCIYVYWLSWRLSGKESACQCRRHRFDPSPGEVYMLWSR